MMMMIFYIVYNIQMKQSNAKLEKNVDGLQIAVQNLQTQLQSNRVSTNDDGGSISSHKSNKSNKSNKKKQKIKKSGKLQKEQIKRLSLDNKIKYYSTKGVEFNTNNTLMFMIDALNDMITNGLKCKFVSSVQGRKTLEMGNPNQKLKKFLTDNKLSSIFDRVTCERRKVSLRIRDDIKIIDVKYNGTQSPRYQNIQYNLDIFTQKYQNEKNYEIHSIFSASNVENKSLQHCIGRYNTTDDNMRTNNFEYIAFIVIGYKFNTDVAKSVKSQINNVSNKLLHDKNDDNNNCINQMPIGHNNNNDEKKDESDKSQNNQQLNTNTNTNSTITKMRMKQEPTKAMIKHSKIDSSPIDISSECEEFEVGNWIKFKKKESQQKFMYGQVMGISRAKDNKFVLDVDIFSPKHGFTKLMMKPDDYYFVQIVNINEYIKLTKMHQEYIEKNGIRYNDNDKINKSKHRINKLSKHQTIKLKKKIGDTESSNDEYEFAEILEIVDNKTLKIWFFNRCITKTEATLDTINLNDYFIKIVTKKELEAASSIKFIQDELSKMTKSKTSF